MKSKKIYLLRYRNKAAETYAVKKVVNSIDFTPGEELEKKEVEKLCNDRNWSVTIEAED